MKNNVDTSTAVDGLAALINALTGAWNGGDAGGFSRQFTPNAVFVAFDGTVLRGPEAISDFHQRAFSTHLAGTHLQLQVEETRLIAASVSVLLTRGGIRRGNETEGPLVGPSIQTLTIREANGRFIIECFQNTRARSIRGPESAAVWRDFDLAWSRLSESNPT